MKSLVFIVVALVLSVSFCQKEEDLPAPADRYSFWRGDIENFYYVLDMNNQPLHLVKGKPYMIIEYDPVSLVPRRCEFGLYEAKNEYLPGAEGAIPEPFMSAASLQYASRLGLTGSVNLLLNWEPVLSYEDFSGGGMGFWLDVSSKKRFNFVKTENSMEGEIQFEEPTWGDAYSDVKAFKLLRKFNSNTIQ